jgi:nicotinate-nucleotide pyrophosphorylase (carboxylating)
MSLDALVRLALAEDLGAPPRDATSEAVIDPEATGAAAIRAKEPLVLAGIEAARATFGAVDPALRFTAERHDGDRLRAGEVAVRIEGSLRAILTAERTALNFLQRLSGIATHTARFVEAVRGTRATILDTRKTTPGWRALEKAAVRAGGGTNHRMGLYDAVLIKDNHVEAAGGVKAAVERARRAAPGSPIEVEVGSSGELEEALASGAGRILLDNMDLAAIREAVKRVAGQVPLEASGGVTLDRVRAIAECGVDFISVGALTHSAPAANLSLDLG